MVGEPPGVQTPTVSKDSWNKIPNQVKNVKTVSSYKHGYKILIKPDWCIPHKVVWKWSWDREVERTTDWRHFLRGSYWAIGSSTIRTRVADPDPGSGAFLTPGSGIGKKSGSGSGINNPDYISESLITIFWFKIQYLNSLMWIRDGKIRNRDGKRSDPGSGINIPDPQHW